jgi:Chaperone of endosialidase
MNQRIQLKRRAVAAKNPITRSHLPCGSIVLALALACLTLSLTAQAATEGDLGNGNTAEGSGALFSLTSGTYNTAMGFQALNKNSTGYQNTANGVNALYSNTTGYYNTANGVDALFRNTTGYQNTANGNVTLVSNTIGINNTASGFGALVSNTSGINNTATGFEALFRNTTGSNNIALGYLAGYNLTTGSNNIDIANVGVAGEANTIRIGTAGTQSATFIAGISGTAVAGNSVVVDANGQLGTTPSSRRFKEQIKSMDKASEAILALRPVSFRYKYEIDPKGIPQFGLVAEEVEKVNPDLVARDAQGKVYTVRYEAVNAMLLNEFLKEHRKVEEQEETISELRCIVGKEEAAIAQQQKELQSTAAQRQKEIQALAARLKEQEWKVEKASDQLEMSKPGPQVVDNNQ